MGSDNSEWNYFVDQSFLGEIEIEAQYCLAAAASVDESLRVHNLGETFRALHSLLAHAAMISKFLWPSVTKPKTKALRMANRASRIRSALALSPDATAVLSNRDLRNTLEHFDERLDDWGAANPVGLVDRNIGSPMAIPEFDSSMKLRHYDPETHRYAFGDQSFDIRKLLAGVREVRNQISTARSRLERVI